VHEENLTEDELQVLGDLYLARMAGLAGATHAEFLPAAHAMCERGWLERRWHGDDVVWWLTTEALTALDLSALTNVEGRDN
jgi:hypothetical protein